MADRPPDFVICCEKHRTPYVMQKYQWMAAQDGWAPTRKGRTSITELRNDSNVAFWQHISSGQPPDGKIRIHHETACGSRNCRNKLSVDVESLEHVFWQIATSVKACANARAQGAQANVNAAAFESLATVITGDVLTVTVAGLRAALQLYNTPR